MTLMTNGWIDSWRSGYADSAEIDFPAFLIILLMPLLAPGLQLFSFPWHTLGSILLGICILINLSADGSFKLYQTSVKPPDRPTALITDGTLRISRHPMYLISTLILFGSSILLGSLTPHFVVVAFIVSMDRVYIKFEAAKLTQIFGQDWLDYKKIVRR